MNAPARHYALPQGPKTDDLAIIAKVRRTLREHGFTAKTSDIWCRGNTSVRIGEYGQWMLTTSESFIGYGPGRLDATLREHATGPTQEDTDHDATA